MMKKMFLFGFMLTLLAFTIGCMGAIKSEHLAGKTYILKNMFEDYEISITFEADRYSIQSPVNIVGGEYKIEGDKFIQNNQFTTMMAGDPASMEDEKKFTDLFSNVDKISLKGKTLTFTTKSGENLVFEEGIIKPYDSATIDDKPVTTNITFADIDGKKFILVNMFQENDITIAFEGNKFSGKAAVNNYNGTFSIDESGFKVADSINTTRMGGTPEQMEAEVKYLDLLKMVVSSNLEGDTLTLETSDGVELVFRMM